MELAGKISSPDMQTFAVQNLGTDSSEVKTLLASFRENHRMINFELLSQWKNKSRKNNRQVNKTGEIIECHLEDRQTDRRTIVKIRSEKKQCTGQTPEQSPPPLGRPNPLAFSIGFIIGYKNV